MKFLEARNQHRDTGTPLQMYGRAPLFHIHRAYIIYGVSDNDLRQKIGMARETRHDVFACTLLHRELRDYSLGQIAFAVFRALFAITQLLCHVSALLTSACKQA